MQYYFQIVDVVIRLYSPFPVLEHSTTKDFFFEYPLRDIPEMELTYQPTDSLPVPEDVRFIEARRIYTGEGINSSTFFCAKPGSDPYAWVSRNNIDEGKLVCRYLPGNEFLMNYSRNALTLMDLEATMLHFNALIIHASLIRWNGSAVLFSAPSGTGKSTQAELWKEYAGAEILNGDRASLRRKEGVWHGYGLPYAGTSGIYRNENAPVRAIVALKQAPENSIRKLTTADAFRSLYSEVMIHRWDTAFESKATELFLSVLKEVPIYLLSCRPDREAVEILKTELEKTENQEVHL